MYPLYSYRYDHAQYHQLQNHQLTPLQMREQDRRAGEMAEALDGLAHELAPLFFPLRALARVLHRRRAASGKMAPGVVSLGSTMHTGGPNR